MALTGRKRSFADALLAGKSKTQAAIAAGLSEKTAAQSGSRLAKDADVLAYMGKKKPKTQRGRGFTEPDGTKSPDAPAGWPFGTAPPAEPPPAVAGKVLTAREFLSKVVNDVELDDKVRLDAAKKLIEFEEAKPAPLGKKEARAEAAKKVSAGRFSAGKAPLALVKR